MKVQIGGADKDKIRQLISSANRDSVDELNEIDRCLAITTQLYAGLLQEELICAWGLIPPTLMSDQAYLWLYTTPKVAEHTFLFVRKSQIAVQAMLEDFPRITGHTAVENRQAIRWLKWLGASFGEAEGGYMPFVIRAKH